MNDILVTGGSGGVGVALCRLLAQNGFRPLVGYRANEAAAQKVAEETEGQAIHLDLTDEASIDAAAEGLKGPLSGLVLCASPPPELGPFTKISSDDMQRQWQVNVAGPQRLLARLIKNHFRKQKAGVVVGVLTSAMGTEDLPAMGGMGAYVMANYALRGMLKVASSEFKWLRCAEIRPDFIETNMLKVFDERYLEMERSRKAKGRFQTPEEAATEIMEIILK